MTTATADETTTADTTAATTSTTTTQDTTTSALAKPAPLAERFPEKFRVTKAEGGEFDAEASTAKVLEAYGALEKRMGSGDMPPKAPEEYTVKLPDDTPEELKEALKDFNLSPEFRKQVHELGITQKQLDAMLGHYFKEAPALMKGSMQRAADEVGANLDKAWGEKYQENFEGAMKAFTAYAEPGMKFDEIMMNPAIAYQILAKVSREMGEAPGVPTDAAGTSADDISALLTSPILQNEKHPEYKALRAKIDAHYAKKHGTQPVT
jgi:hypothetical protein